MDWVGTVKRAIGKGREHYELAARTIVEARRADPSLTQKEVASRIGMSPPWVCDLLKWYRRGCPPETVFGPEAAARRAKSIQTSESGNSPSPGLVYANGRLMRDGPYWQPWLSLGDEIVIDGGPDAGAVSQPPPGVGQSTVRVLGIIGLLSTGIKTLAQPEPLTREQLAKTYANLSPAKKRATLTRLAGELDKLLTLGEELRTEVLAALKDTPRVLDDEADEMDRPHEGRSRASIRVAA